MLKVETVQQPILYDVTFRALTEIERERLLKLTVSLNGSAEKPEKRARAGKRTVVKKNTKTKSNTMVCRVGGELIKTQGSKQHMRAHARKEGWKPEDIERLNQGWDNG